MKMNRLKVLNVLKTNLFLSINEPLLFKLSEKKVYGTKIKWSEADQKHYDDISKFYKYPKISVMRILHEMYDVDFIKCEKILKNYDFINLLPIEQLTKNCNSLKKENVSVDRILKHIKILSISNLSDKIELTKQLPYSTNDLFPLFILSIRTLRRLLTDDFLRQLEFMSKIVGVPVVDVCKLWTKSAFNERSLRALEERFNLLRSYGMSVEEINKDCDVFKLDVNLLTHRLDELKQHGIKNFDSKLLCKSEDVYQKKLRQKLLTGGSTTQEYLTKKLKLTPEQLNNFTLRIPLVFKKNVEAIEALIDNLLSRGFTTEHIIMCPTILMTSLARVEKRLNELNNLEERKTELYRVVGNEKLYRRYFSRI